MIWMGILSSDLAPLVMALGWGVSIGHDDDPARWSFWTSSDTWSAPFWTLCGLDSVSAL
jgi:hypothetical protein